MSKPVFTGICAELNAKSEHINPPRVTLESGTGQSSFTGKYVKIVFKDLTDPPGTHIASCNYFLLFKTVTTYFLFDPVHKRDLSFFQWEKFKSIEG